MDRSLLTVDELAQILKVPKSWIYGKTREAGPESMPRLYIGKYLRFFETDVMNWLKKQNRNQN